jgi:hypothetical protein
VHLRPGVPFVPEQRLLHLHATAFRPWVSTNKLFSTRWAVRMLCSPCSTGQNLGAPSRDCTPSTPLCTSLGGRLLCPCWLLGSTQTAAYLCGLFSYARASSTTKKSDIFSTSMRKPNL